MSRKIETIGNHYIVCGYGRMGRSICEGLVENGVSFVVIDNSDDIIAELEEKGYLYVRGDATNDDIMLLAGVERAKGLVAVIRTDAENVFAALSAKELNPGIYVVARAIDEGTESKLIKAGADRVVKPYELGGSRMVQLLLRPGVMDFIDGVARNKNVDINLEEVYVQPDSGLCGKSLAQSPIRSELNIIIVALLKKSGEFIYNPKSTALIEAGDKLIAIGNNKDLNKLTELCLKRGHG